MSLRLVVLGMMGAYPFGGQTWLYLNWLTALSSLGHEVWYVEDNGFWQYDPRIDGPTDDCDYAVKHVARAMAGVGLADRWMYRWREPDACWGGTERGLDDLYRTCDALLNVCAATELRDHHLVAPYRVWVETDPVVSELRIAAGDERIRSQMLDLHHAYATYGENYGAQDCGVPLPDVQFVKTRQPIDLDQWSCTFDPTARDFTTIANYRMEGYDVEVAGDSYGWSKHQQWERFRDLPQRTSQPFRLALKASDEDMEHLRTQGWQVEPALTMSLDPFGTYRSFIQRSRGEFTVAKDQNIRLRSGWFSERDACYLASGKPVVAQDTAFVLPSGDGLFAVTDVAGAAAAVDEVNSDYERHCRAARQLAEEYLDGPAVAARLLADLGMG